jgi:hypothetical protein
MYPYVERTGSMWKFLPREVVHLILALDTTIHYCPRTGRYTDRIPRYDPRYALIHTIPRPRVSDNSDLTVLVNFSDRIRVLVMAQYGEQGAFRYTLINKADKYRIHIDEHWAPFWANGTDG